MDTPLAKAANRGAVLNLVPMMLAFPLQIPSDSTYFLTSDDASEIDPASASPKPSRIDFLPSAKSSSGISSYFVFTINSETYCVTRGACSDSSEDLLGIATRRPDFISAPKTARPTVFLQKSRRSIRSLPLSLDCISSQLNLMVS